MLDYTVPRVHSLDTNTVMKTRFIFGTQCAVAKLAARDRKLAAQLRYQYWYLSCVCNKSKLRSRLWCCSTIYASEHRLGGGAKSRALYQKLVMGKIGVFITVLVSKLWLRVKQLIFSLALKSRSNDVTPSFSGNKKFSRGWMRGPRRPTYRTEKPQGTFREITIFLGDEYHKKYFYLIISMKSKWVSIRNFFS